MMIQLNWERMTQAETDCGNVLVRASIWDTVKTSEAQNFINDGVFESENDLKYVKRMQRHSYLIDVMTDAL